MEEKKKLGLIYKILIGIGILILLFVSYIFLIEPKRLQIVENQIVKTNLPENFNGFKVAVFGDVHYGTTIHYEELSKAINEINGLSPDFIIFTGDLFDSSIIYTETQYNELTNLLSKLKATQRMYAVYGDSDIDNNIHYDRIMSDSGFTILKDANEVFYYKGSTPIMISGILPNGSLENTIKTDEEVTFNILISHYPNVVNEVTDEITEIVFAGHSLGGTIDLPFAGSLIKKDNVDDYYKGHYNINNISLFVHNGLGSEKYKFRFNNIPSIHLYRLYNF